MSMQLRYIHLEMPRSLHHAVMLSMVNSYSNLLTVPFSASSYCTFFFIIYVLRAEGLLFIQFGTHVTSESDDYLVDSLCYSVIFLHVSSGPLLFILGVFSSLEIKVEEYKQ